MISLSNRFRFFRRKKWPILTLEEIRKRARILIIDESDFLYFKFFLNDGYTIEKWNNIKDLQKLESGYFDIILFDINSVDRNLQHVHPTQIIVAYSEADSSMKFHEFFQRADAVLAKSLDYVQFKKTVDNLLYKRFSIDFYVDHIEHITNIYLLDQEKVNKLASDAILDCNPGRLISYLNAYIDNKDIIALVLQIVQVAIGIGSLCS